MATALPDHDCGADLLKFIEANETANGVAILIGNDYDNEICKKQNLRILKGPKKDVLRAESVFKQFGAACYLKLNATAYETKTIVKTASTMSYPSSYDWIVFIYCGHGADENALLAQDGQRVYVQYDIINPFQPERSMKIAKIPKLFFIDACRGNEETRPIFIPRGPDRFTPRGGTGHDSVAFPPKGNMLVAYPSLSHTQCYEIDGEGGLWLNKVLNRLASNDDLSVPDILQKVNGDIRDYYQKRCNGREMSMQQAEYNSTLHDVFKFKKVPSMVPSCVKPEITTDTSQCTQELNVLVHEMQRIKKRDYKDLPGPGNHVELQITHNDGRVDTFKSEAYYKSYECINNAREIVAKHAVCRLKSEMLNKDTEQGIKKVSGDSSPLPIPIPVQRPRGAPRKGKEHVGMLKNILVDKMNKEPVNYDEIEPRGLKYQCTAYHSCFPREGIKGEWRRSKQDAKQTAAEAAIDYLA